MTVVIPSRNEGDWLVRTVRSIRENESADTEIIHVDDASTLPEPSEKRCQDDFSAHRPLV